MPRKALLRVLARAFLAGEPVQEQIVDRASLALGRPWRWLIPVARRYVNAFGGETRPRRREVLQFLSEDRGFRRASLKYSRRLSVAQWLTAPEGMQPVFAAQDWEIPSIESPAALSDWFHLNPGELEWYADLKGLGYKKTHAPLRHYYYRVLAKPSGSVRLIEAPKSRLKHLQRQILAGILEQIPPHPAVHGFVKGRSIKTFVTPHVGQRVVLRMDLRDFFPSFTGARIQALFRTAGYPESVADLLGGVCTNVAPPDVSNATPDVWNATPAPWDVRAMYGQPHLPQGAPTSPALANLCCWRVDCRLAGLAQAAGANYTRYADDLAFSGDEAFERRVDRFSTHVAAILQEEGFSVNHRKTRIMRRSVRQHLAGLVTNQRINIKRTDFDLLKATLVNCIRTGPEGQNREAHPQFQAHLNGRVAFVEMVNPARGLRLRKLFEKIPWH